MAAKRLAFFYAACLLILLLAMRRPGPSMPSKIQAIGHDAPTAAKRETEKPPRTRRQQRSKPKVLRERMIQKDAPPIPPYNFTHIVLENKLSRPFSHHFKANNIPPANRSESWCVPSYEGRRVRHGLLYNKMPKAASSTMSGVALRIAEHYAKRYYANITSISATIPCMARVDHIPGYKAGAMFRGRVKGQSFLFSTIRNPAKRALSRVFFSRMSQMGREPTDRNILKWLNTSNSQYGAVSPGMGGFQLAYLSFQPIEKGSAWSWDEPTNVRDPEIVHDIVRQIMQDYDLLMLVERFDESLIVMQLLLELDVTDILYLSSKHAGAYYYSPRTKECIKLVPTSTSERVGRHLASAEFYAKSYGDYVLYEAASQSLDLTIDKLGKERFEKALNEFLKLKERAEEKCAAKAIFPCSPEGKAQLELSETSCYHNDWGCGGPCLDLIGKKQKERGMTRLAATNVRPDDFYNISCDISQANLSVKLQSTWREIDKLVKTFPKSKVSGGIFLYPRQQAILTTMVRELAAAMMRSHGRPLRICETGFGAGHSAALFLAASNDTLVLSFDKFDRPYQMPAANFLSSAYPDRLLVFEGDSCQTVPKRLSSHWNPETPPPNGVNATYQCDLLHGSSLCRSDNLDLVSNSPKGAVLTSTSMNSLSDKEVYFGSNAQWTQLRANNCINNITCFEEEEIALDRDFVFSRRTHGSDIKHSFCMGIVSGKCGKGRRISEEQPLYDLTKPIGLKNMCRTYQVNVPRTG